MTLTNEWRNNVYLAHGAFPSVDPPGPDGWLDGHYFHTLCPSVTKKQKRDTAQKQNTPQRKMGPGGSLWSLLTCFSI